MEIFFDNIIDNKSVIKEKNISSVKEIPLGPSDRYFCCYHGTSYNIVQVIH